VSQGNKGAEHYIKERSQELRCDGGVINNLKTKTMYIIEFEPNVYAAKGKGDPARTLKLKNAIRFDKKEKAEKRLAEIVQEIRPLRKFKNPQVKWVDEVSGTLAQTEA
jgi:hypothetical protein